MIDFQPFSLWGRGKRQNQDPFLKPRKVLAAITAHIRCVDHHGVCLFQHPTEQSVTPSDGIDRKKMGQVAMLKIEQIAEPRYWHSPERRIGERPNHVDSLPATQANQRRFIARDDQHRQFGQPGLAQAFVQPLPVWSVGSALAG